MIRLAALPMLVAAVGCAGPVAPVPTGFEDTCVSGPSIGGKTEMGMTNEGFHTDIDAKLRIAGRTDGGCVGASLGGES